MNIRQLRAAAAAVLAGLALTLAQPAAAAQVNIGLQGTLINPNNNQPYTGAQACEFKIYKGGNASTAGSGTLVYDETVSITPATSGVFSHALGAGTAVGAALSTSAFSGAGPIYVEIAVGGTVLLPRLQLLGAPYASIAGSAETLAPGAVIIGSFTVTGTGADPSITTSSGVLVQAGGVTAPWLRLTATGSSQPSLTTSSGVVVQAGGVTAPYVSVSGNVSAAQFIGSGALLTGISGTPIGSIVAYAGGTEPSGWVECDGRSLSQSGTAAASWGNFNTASLFAAIGTVWGSSGAGQYNIPDLRGIFPRGWNHGKSSGSYRDLDAGSRVAQYASGATGDAIGSYQVDAFKDHTHAVPGAHPIIDGGSVAAWSNSTGGIGATTTGSSSSGGTETRPINASVMYLIRVQ